MFAGLLGKVSLLITVVMCEDFRLEQATKHHIIDFYRLGIIIGLYFVVGRGGGANCVGVIG
jgi:hypothetical protein